MKLAILSALGLLALGEVDAKSSAMCLYCKKMDSSIVSSTVIHTARLQTSALNANGTTSINIAHLNGLKDGCLISIKIAKLNKLLESVKLSVHMTMLKRKHIHLPLCKLDKSVP